MNNYIIKNENGEIITNSAERNIILLRYAAFLNENNSDINSGFQQQIHASGIQQQIQAAAAAVVPQIQFTEQVIPQLPQPKKSTKSSAIQNAQGANVATNQKLSG